MNAAKPAAARIYPLAGVRGKYGEKYITIIKFTHPLKFRFPLSAEKQRQYGADGRNQIPCAGFLVFLEAGAFMWF